MRGRCAGWMQVTDVLEISSQAPVLIAGPTASGKSALALRIAEKQGGRIINADALQVFDGWRILTARPDARDLVRVDHKFYGHVPFDAPYSTGDWLRDVAPLLEGPRPIFVGGTGLYFTALTEGLAQIPPTPPAVRAEADNLPLDILRQGIDAKTLATLDIQNRMRVQRAWEVQRATGRSIRDWQAATPPPLLPLADTAAIVMEAPKDWLTPRIERRFDMMLDQGALGEAAAMEPHWSPDHQSSKAIGAAELIAHLRGQMTLDDARAAAIIATRQYAKRQRTWFRKRMAGWHSIDMMTGTPSDSIRLL